SHPKIAALHELVRRLLAARQPTLAICLGHQILASVLGLELLRRDVPYQGVQREIDFFGRPERVGFYSTYTARGVLDGVELARIPVGLPTDPAYAFVWLWTATVAWNSHLPWRAHLRFARDWAPAVALLVGYTASRGYADNGAVPHVLELLDADTQMWGWATG